MVLRLTFLIALCMLGLVSVASPAWAQERGSLTLRPISFESASGQRVAAEEGRLWVPENRSNPNSRLIELAFVRFRSTAATPGSPIVYLAGGPGGSGIAAARSSRFPLFMALRQIGDVIALDQRGTGASQPSLGCDQPINVRFDRPLTFEVLLEEHRRQSRACAESLRSRGVDLAGYTTAESADDLNDLRLALRAPKLSLWGISYGTHLGLAFIRRHGEVTDRAILAGVEGPDHTLKLPASYHAHLREMQRLIDEDPQAARVYPDFANQVARVMQRLRRNPVTVEARHPDSGEPRTFVINDFLLRQLLNSTWGTGDFEMFPFFFAAADRGDFSMFVDWLMEEEPSLSSAMSHAMDCASGASPERLAELQRQSGDPIFGNLNFPFPEVCDVWNVPDLGQDFRGPLSSRVPVLFISGTLDAKTPVANAQEVGSGFPNGVHLIIENAVHSDGVLLSSPLILEGMIAFLRGQPLPSSRITLPRPRFVTSFPPA